MFDKDNKFGFINNNENSNNINSSDIKKYIDEYDAPLPYKPSPQQFFIETLIASKFK